MSQHEKGRIFWRSLAHAEGSPEYQKFVEDEFPAGADELADPVSRRSFLQLMGASAALAGFGTACVRRPEEQILPYVRRPEDMVPGLPQFYASTMSFGDMVTGVVVEAHQGRPTKIEGNKLHPASLGAACTFEQAAVLSLYDPDRTTRVFQNGAETTWAAFDTWLDSQLATARNAGGRGVVVLADAVRSPSQAQALARLKEALPSAQIFQWSAVGGDEVLAGTRLAFGQDLEPIFRLQRADTIVDVDADLFGAGPMRLRYSHDWATRRTPDAPGGMNRLWVAEAVYSVTGGAADHRIRIRRSQAGLFLRALAAELQKAGVTLPSGIAQASDLFPAKPMQALAKELASARGRSVVAIGRHHAPEVQALAWAINDALGNTGKTVRFVPAQLPVVSNIEQIRAAAAAMNAGPELLFVLGGNPAFDAPADLGVAQAIAKAKNVVHLTEAPNETSKLAAWVLPETHFLEEWSDAVAVDGAYSLVQPLILPIWEGRSKLEMLSRLAGQPKDGYDLVREYFLANRGDEAAWRRTLHDGVLEGSAGRWAEELTLDESGVATAAAKVPASAEGLELAFYVDEKLYDGRFANNAWLQELPDPMTKITWSNAALVGPSTARRLGVDTRDVVKLTAGGSTIELPVWVQPGLAEDTVAVALGWGRTDAGRVGEKKGWNAYPLRSSAAMWTVPGAQLAKTGGKFVFATTQEHHSMEDRPIVREMLLADYQANPFGAREQVKHPPLLALWKQHEYVGQQWGMAIDLNRCVGCNGCMIACQAENNIPVVGPEQVLTGREMYWIRLDRYFASTNVADPADLADPEVVFQPVTCMQCENAPCENVCPVAATVHSKDGGLNDMVYNRCIGTRYCSNNCPYKVRRFNFLDFHKEAGLTDVEKMAFNPNVTVRTRGVMEKCTYCVQRISAARRDAKVSGLEKIPDGGVTPACAQACPTEAIVFGDINDPNSRVTALKKQPRNYDLLGELNTKPRTSYLARIRNPNPELVS